MRPSVARQHSTNSFAAHTKRTRNLRDIAARHLSSMDKRNIILRQFGHPVSRATNDPIRMEVGAMPLSTSGALSERHVGHILVMATEFEMLGVDTLPVITFVPHNHAGRNRTIRERIGQPMRAPLFTGHLDPTISLWANPALPPPARVSATGHIDKSPDIFGGGPSGLPLAFDRAVLGRTTLDVSRPSHECPAAPFTGSSDRGRCTRSRAIRAAIRLRWWAVKLPPTAYTNTVRGILGVHFADLLSGRWGATLRAAATAPGHFIAPIIPDFLDSMRFLLSGMVVALSAMPTHIAGEHPRGTLGFSPVLSKDLGEV